MFEITKNQLRQLNDVQLRELVARLCEAELQMAGAPVSAVRWAGAHTAPDAGLDVDCQVDDKAFRGDFVPRPRTGFQIKKPAMPPAKIAIEMSPKGKLRPIFSELAASNGCYIIASLDDDPAGNAAAQRQKAMRDQLHAVSKLGDLKTDFYGCAELANWVRQHPSVTLWVRDVLGIPLDGWKPHGRWTNTPLDVNDELICNPGLSISLPRQGVTKLDIEKGIEQIRSLVRTSGNALRVVGLSGVGKTRIIQALFEDSVGCDPLNRSLAIYADLGTEPTPSPRQMLARLSTEGRPAILVLDNCPVDTHNLLASEISTTSKLHLITIEYDIREDKPEVTTVIRINAKGTKIVETLVSRRFPHLGQVNSCKIAEFSGGNARLALALADAVDEEENLSGFSNAQLFDRLLYQREPHDANFLAAAQTLSLVYSYSVSTDEGGVDELAMLGELVGQNRLALYGVTQTLIERQLAQKRGNWRAILPPAFSNKLAASALNKIPVDHLNNTFKNLKNPRLLISFGKRLGYLHNHAVAVKIVKCWMSPGGLLNKIDTLDENLIQLLVNVAPVAPNAVLDAIEARMNQTEANEFLCGGTSSSMMVVQTLCAIAYDATLFERCVSVLVLFAISENRKQQVYIKTMGHLYALFSLYLSGTDAKPDIREATVRHFLFSKDHDESKAGLWMLEATLDAGQWSSMATFEFGARPRSPGYEPQTPKDHDSWFLRFLEVACEVALGEDEELQNKARDILANKFGDLWQYKGLRQELYDTAAAVHKRQPWLQGWRAVRAIKHYDSAATGAKETDDDRELLDQLDDLMRPEKLSEKIQAYVCEIGHQQLAIDDEFDLDSPQKYQESASRAEQRAYNLGVITATDQEVLDKIAPDLFRAECGYVLHFGKGLASVYGDLRHLWSYLLGHLVLAGDSLKNYSVMYGALEVIRERDEPLACTILTESVENRILRKNIVELCFSVPMIPGIIKIYHRALDFGDTPLNQFDYLAWRLHQSALSEQELCGLFRRVLDKHCGARIILSGLSMRIHSLLNGKLTFGEDLKKIGLLASAALFRDGKKHHGGTADHHLTRVLKFCLDKSVYSQETKDVLDAFFCSSEGILRQHVWSSQCCLPSCISLPVTISGWDLL